MELRRKLTLIGFLLLKILLPILTIFTILISCKTCFVLFMEGLASDPNSIFHPLITDDELVAIFNENDQQFALLAQILLSENKTVKIYPSRNLCRFTYEGNIETSYNLSCQNYIMIFQNLGLMDADTHLYAGGETITLTVDSYGLIPGSQSKGYYYAPEGLPAFGILSDNTDYTDGQFVYQHLGGDWYIFHYR